MNLYRGGAWRFKAFADCPAIYTNKPPNWFHRLMQRALFGFQWLRD